MIHQLRIYQIFDHNKHAFHQRFRDHGARIMRRHGFRIVAMWEASGAGSPEFVYILEWPDEDSKARAWEQFMADEEWARIKRETAAERGSLVGEIADRTIMLTDYSPSFGSAGQYPLPLRRDAHHQ